MASGPCLRRYRVVRRYMPTHIKCERLYVKLSSSIHVSMYLRPFREVSAVNTGVPRPKVPIHRKLGPDGSRRHNRQQAHQQQDDTPPDVVKSPPWHSTKIAADQQGRRG